MNDSARSRERYNRVALCNVRKSHGTELYLGPSSTSPGHVLVTSVDSIVVQWYATFDVVNFTVVSTIMAAQCEPVRGGLLPNRALVLGRQQTSRPMHNSRHVEYFRSFR